MCFTASRRKPSTPVGVEIPLAPVERLLTNLGALEVQIAAHQVGEVPLVERDLVVEGLALQEVDGVLLLGVPRVVVHGVEVAVMPFEGRVLASPSGETEVGVGVDVARRALGPQPVVLGEGSGADRLRRVAAHAVVQDHVAVDRKPRGLEGLNCAQVLGLGAVFRPHRALLVELAEVVHVVHAVAHVVRAAGPLVGGRQPDRRDARLGQLLGLLRRLVPERAVARRGTSGSTASSRRSRRTWSGLPGQGASIPWSRQGPEEARGSERGVARRRPGDRQRASRRRPRSSGNRPMTAQPPKSSVTTTTSSLSPASRGRNTDAWPRWTRPSWRGSSNE